METSTQGPVEEKASPAEAPGPSVAARTTEAQDANTATVVTPSAEKSRSVPEFMGGPAGDLERGPHDSPSASSIPAADEGDSGRCGGRDKTLRQVLRGRAVLRVRKQAALKRCSSVPLLTPAKPARVAAARRRTRALFARDARATRRQRRREAAGACFSHQQQDQAKDQQWQEEQHRQRQQRQRQQLGWEQLGRQRMSTVAGMQRMAWNIRKAMRVIKADAFRVRVWRTRMLGLEDVSKA